MKIAKNYYRGCLLGGACGDAMGYPVELMDWNQIRSAYGALGITELPINAERKEALFSDDTQMAILTVDGLLWADKKAKERGIYAYTSSLFYCYQKWLYTQIGHFADKNYSFLLGGEILAQGLRRGGGHRQGGHQAQAQQERQGAAQEFFHVCLQKSQGWST